MSKRHSPLQVAKQVLANYRRCTEGGEAISYAETLDLPTGRSHFHTTLIPVRSSGGRIDRLVGIAVDITEQKRMEQALAERERAFRSLAEHAPDRIARYDLEGRLVYGNPRLIETMGGDLSKILGKRPSDHVSDDRFAVYEARMR